jgi:hypothetical protein
MKSTDIVPIVTSAWNCSFAKTSNNQKAILERGWLPATRALIALPSVLRTKHQSKVSNLTTLSIVASMIPSMLPPSTNKPISLDDLNQSFGMAVVLLEISIKYQRNNPQSMRKKWNNVIQQT